jgi:hypothetical protein
MAVHSSRMAPKQDDTSVAAEKADGGSSLHMHVHSHCHTESRAASDCFVVRMYLVSTSMCTRAKHMYTCVVCDTKCGVPATPEARGSRDPIGYARSCVSTAQATTLSSEAASRAVAFIVTGRTVSSKDYITNVSVCTCTIWLPSADISDIIVGRACQKVLAAHSQVRATHNAFRKSCGQMLTSRKRRALISSLSLVDATWHSCTRASGEPPVRRPAFMPRPLFRISQSDGTHAPTSHLALRSVPRATRLSLSLLRGASACLRLIVAHANVDAGYYKTQQTRRSARRAHARGRTQSRPAQPQN